jgi:methyltransferase family protein
MAETHFDEWIAARYETLWPELFEPALVESTVDFLAALARTGPALELGIGTGRIAVPLSRRNVPVHGIELSPAMVARLHADPDGAGIDVTPGDFATATWPSELDLMARLAGLTPRERWADWHRTPFTSASRHHISVWQKRTSSPAGVVPAARS